MDFTSNIFVLVILSFYTIYFILYRFIKDRVALLNLFIAISSLLIYALWFPPAVLILLVYSFLARYGGMALHKSRSRLLLGIMVVFIVAILGFFKYYAVIMSWVTGNPGENISIFVPIGISFFTCTLIGYFIDLYRGQISPPESMLDSLLLISFWPSISSGPILRAGNFFKHLKQREPITRSTIALSLVFIASGLIKKLLIADNLGAYVNWNLGFGVERMDFHEAWITIMGFLGQIYGDFSGYSDMAIGFALLLGIKLPANFNYPFISTTITELWRRWHISFSFWLRDYVYISLGGSKKGKARQYVNIIISFVISGLWHGTGFGYLIWGLIHGVAMVLERMFYKSYVRLNNTLRGFITIMIFIVSAAFFRLDVPSAIIVIQKMFFYHSLNFRLSTAQYVLSPLILLSYLAIEHAVKFYHVDERGYPILNTKPSAIIILCIMLFLALVFPGQELPFIYFQF